MQETKLEFTMTEFEQALKKADELMKADNGHLFEHILKTRCVFCGKSPMVKTKCSYWFQTYLEKLKYVLMNKETIIE